MGILAQVSRIIDVVLTDKGKQILSLKDNQSVADLITKFAIFDEDINYKNVDFTYTPRDPNYPTFFTLEPNRAENASSFKSRLITIPAGSSVYNKAFPESPDFSDGMRVIEASPFKADIPFEESATITVVSKNFQGDTGEPIFDQDTSYIVYLKNADDAQYVDLSEIVSDVALTPSEDPEPEVL